MSLVCGQGSGGSQRSHSSHIVRLGSGRIEVGSLPWLPPQQGHSSWIRLCRAVVCPSTFILFIPLMLLRCSPPRSCTCRRPGSFCFIYSCVPSPRNETTAAPQTDLESLSDTRKFHGGLNHCISLNALSCVNNSDSFPY